MERSLGSLYEALIPGLPSSGYYIPNFISLEEEECLLQKVVLTLMESDGH